MLPSATVALPCAASPRHAPPHLTGPHQNYPLKRAAEEAEASCAAVCNCSGAPPCHTQPRHTSPNLAVPARAASTLQREQQGASCKAPCCRLQLLLDPNLPYLSWPDHTAPSRNAPQSAKPKPTTTTLQREQQGRLAPSVLPSATRTSPSPAALRHTLPCCTLPHLPSKESSREDRSPQCCRLQL